MTAQVDVEVSADELLARLKRINAMIRRGLAEAGRGETEYLGRFAPYAGDES